ncbi:DUF3077 domain-containing protein [Pseudomonas nunensis]|uniref:DUF3077 domain-containing protein n=1 Tax=Pseudomonas nunensis TaxID=2961896 RepID=UPI0025B063E1|nr:DUF3077 domain-containing protein [Pseudomonas nunensis]
MTEPSETKTIGVVPFIYCSENPLFRVSAGVPVEKALAMASDLLCLSKALAEDAAFTKDTDRFAWASHYMTEMGKAVIDDVIKAVTPRSARAKDAAEV